MNIRRQLVDEGHLVRTPDGFVSQYAATGPSREDFDADVENVSLDAVIQKRKALRTQKRRDFLKSAFSKKNEKDLLFSINFGKC